MARVALVLALAGSAMVAFGIWGMFTDQGRFHYDEMAGIIPFGASVLGGLLLASAALIAIVRAYRRSRRH